MSSLRKNTIVLRALAVAATVRAIMSVWLLGSRVRLWLAASDCRLVMLEEGLWFDLGGQQRAIARDDIVGIREEGDWRERSGGLEHCLVLGSKQDHLVLALRTFRVGAFDRKVQRFGRTRGEDYFGGARAHESGY